MAWGSTAAAAGVYNAYLSNPPLHACLAVPPMPLLLRDDLCETGDVIVLGVVS